MLESNTLELEESLAAYERGVVLLGSLQKRLGAAEQHKRSAAHRLTPRHLFR